MNPSALLAFWDDAISAFLSGGPAVPSPLEDWARSYRGGGRGAVVFNAFPEPFLGPLLGQPAGVFLALNPGQAHLHFQGRDSVFATEIRALGSYSQWAASWPYLRNPWVTEMGKNRHHESRLSFLKTWTDNPRLAADSIVAFELYPWHSTSVTGALRPPATIVRDMVLEPVRALGAPVFAFGAPWFAMFDALHLELVDMLGAGGRPYGSEVPSRTVAVWKGQGDLTVIAERHSGSAGPPRRSEALRMRGAIFDAGHLSM